MCRQLPASPSFPVVAHCPGSHLTDRGKEALRVGSAARVLGEAPQHQCAHRFGEHLDRGRAGLMPGRQLRCVIGIERRRADEAFEERHGGGIHIAARPAYRTTDPLLGREVKRCRSRQPQPAVGCPEPEVGQPYPAGVRPARARQVSLGQGVTAARTA